MRSLLILTEAFSNVETRTDSQYKREQTIAVKDLLLEKNVLANYRLWEKLDFYIVLVGARKYNENKYRRSNLV
jgi:hypothetical protein